MRRLFFFGESGTEANLGRTGPAAGIYEGVEFSANACRLDPGATLLFQTDGLTDARNEEGEEFGRDRLVELLERPAESVAEALDRIRQSLYGHMDGAPLFDDLTLVVLRRKDASRQLDGE